MPFSTSENRPFPSFFSSSKLPYPNFSARHSARLRRATHQLLCSSTRRRHKAVLTQKDTPGDPPSLTTQVQTSCDNHPLDSPPPSTSPYENAQFSWHKTHQCSTPRRLSFPDQAPLAHPSNQAGTTTNDQGMQGLGAKPDNRLSLGFRHQ